MFQLKLVKPKMINFNKIKKVKTKSSIIMNGILVLLTCLAIYIVKEVKQPFGIAALVGISISFLFNFLKKKAIAISLFSFGILASCIILFVAFAFSRYTNSQKYKFTSPTPVIFEKSSFNDALIKAKAANKKVFIDFYASWCPPCLAFEENILTDKVVGTYMNDAFINVKYDAEKGEGKIIAKQYNVKAYPAIFILDGDGKITEVLANETVPSKEEMIEVARKYKRLAK